MAGGSECAAKPCGFIEDGSRYVVRDVHLMERADADLWNDALSVMMDHRGRCHAGFTQPNRTAYSDNWRTFYVRDEESGRFWSAPYDPVQAEPQEFEFSAGTADIQWRNVTDGLEVALRLVVPRNDTVELWTAVLRNVSDRPRRVSFYPCFPVGVLGLLAHQAWFDRKLNGLVHDYFPYYVKFEDYFKLRRLKNQVCCLADVVPEAFECNAEEFKGWRGWHDPAQLRQPRLAGGDARGDVWADPSAAIFQYVRELAPGEALTVNFVFGPARDAAEMRRLKRKYLAPGGIEKALREVQAFQARYAPSVRVETPDAEFNHFLNRWLPNRALFLGRTLRLTFAPQGRNAIQDAMGATYVEPAQARYWFERIWAHQHRNGWMPHGMKFVPECEAPPINSIPHKDINVWGAPALYFYLCETGDEGLLDVKVPFADDRPGAKGVPLYVHVCLGLDWLLKDRSARGLSHIGQGDWNDPLNMAGYKGRGESTWLTEALTHALDLWAEVCERRGDGSRAKRYRREAEACRAALNRHMWDGQWYARGSTDAGRNFGTRRDKEGRIFINAQSWALICGAATGKRVDATLASVRRYLLTPAGAMTLFPPFTRMREDIGKLSQKVPGTGENGSAYCHASTFLAFALFCARRSGEAFGLLRCLLPGGGGNTLARAGQIPLYVPNFYRGTACGRSAGRSSHSPNTGTAAWYYRTAIGMLLGVRGEFGGLRLDPQLPKGWERVRVWREFRGAEFDIEIVIVPGLRHPGPRVTLDGQELPGNLVPFQKRGSRHAVRVALPE